jgi:hypothetical protein
MRQSFVLLVGMFFNSLLIAFEAFLILFFCKFL